MVPYESLYAWLEARGQSAWVAQLRESLPHKLAPACHGRMAEWLPALAALPQVRPSRVELAQRVAIGTPDDLGDTPEQQLIDTLMAFHPWRKGPLELFGVTIDTEWRSDWKWQRVAPHIAPLSGRAVLDVGCGNGYYGWRMRGAGAEMVVGIDPTLVSVLQFQLFQTYLNDPQHHLLPIGIEELPAELGCFDTVFSMGVLYHRRSPLDHLLELKGCLKNGGELVLETLVVEGEEGYAFLPPGRYAKMRNVWFLPSVPTLVQWLARSGFRDVRCVDVTATSRDEQRTTEWMTFESLPDFLDPDDTTRTIEGHPAPLRAVFTAVKP
ncbi:MAG: tRNA 5-methoxyuridine(34)/uridine 5-oxyacetic acid(34) synthase CmoB [Desulfuromonas sp.]|nr:MAG: tRNA 5-methoxyuridine(34)/uridine 5-oxyacetic acid(34) synthase CmoB [Desulfuromonas sp.]